jgi:DNA-binding transcriptional LysR family regulator
MLQSHRLTALVQLERHGSITGAAKALGYTPPAVSQTLAALEREAGVSLFERGPRSIRLTDAGRRLAAHARVIQSSIAAAEAEMRSVAGLETGTMRIAAFPSAAASLLPSLIEATRARLPGASISFEELAPRDALAALRAAEVDLAIVYDFADAPLRPPDDIRLTRLGYDPFRLCVAREHQLARLPVVDIRATRELPWIIDGPPPADACFTMRYLRRRGIEPEVIARSDDMAVIHKLIAAGFGIGMLPVLQFVGRADVAQVRLSAPPPPRRVLSGTRRTSTSTMLDTVIELLGTAHGLTRRPR